MKRLGVLTKQISPLPCSSEGQGVLSGIRVVELATVMAAPLSAALLADYGAEVIKIEDPKSPDVTREWGFGDDFAKTADPSLVATVEGGGSSFVQLNRGKKSIALNPTSPEGNALLKKLLGTADIFITNVRGKSLRKVGLDYESLKSEFPKLIYGHLSAFGRAGEMIDDPGYDFGAFWAQTGLMDLVRASDDAPMPREPGGIGDYNTGFQMMGGIFAALYHRERTGRGQLVDAALMRAGLWSMGQPIVALMGGNQWATGVEPRTGTKNSWHIRATTEIGERGSFTTKIPVRLKDGSWIQLLGNDIGRFIPKLPPALGISMEELYGPDMRNIDWKKANKVADEIFASKTLAEWEPILKEHDVWYKPVHKFEDNLDPASPAYRQAQAIGFYAQAPGISQHDLIGTPVILSDMTATPRAPAPKFSQHTEDVMQELGVAKEDIGRLTEKGVLGFSRGLWKDYLKKKKKQA